MRKIDVFTHISPPGYSEGVERLAELKDIGKRSRGVPMLHDLDIRFRVMDMFPGYQQVLSLPTPPIELFAQPAQGIELARIANDSMAELVRKHPDRFVGFAAALPMNDPDAALAETQRAVGQLGARAFRSTRTSSASRSSRPSFCRCSRRWWDTIYRFGCTRTAARTSRTT